MNTRRQFLIKAPLAVLTTAIACKGGNSADQAVPSQSTPGAPPVFGAGQGSGPAVTTETFAEAEKLMQVTMTPAERKLAADTWRNSMAPYLERRTGPRKFALKDSDVPALVWNPVLPGFPSGPTRSRFVRSTGAVPALPSKDDDIAFAPVAHLSKWIESKKITSTRLTNIYLERISRLNPKINAIITVTKDHALQRAAKLPLHPSCSKMGVPSTAT